MYKRIRMTIPIISKLVILLLLSILFGCNTQKVNTKVIPKELFKENISNIVERKIEASTHESHENCEHDHTHKNANKTPQVSQEIHSHSYPSDERNQGEHNEAYHKENNEQ